MTISLEDGIVVCSLEDKDSKSVFLSDTYECFKGYYNHKLRINPLYGDDRADRLIFEVKAEIRLIDMLLFYADFWGVEVDEAVRTEFAERLSVLNAILSAEEERLQNERQEREKVKLWEDKCKNGCGKCKYRKRGYDDNFCKASGSLELLEEKQVPKYTNGIHYLFNYEPFPSENCPYRINQSEEKTA